MGSKTLLLEGKVEEWGAFAPPSSNVKKGSEKVRGSLRFFAKILGNFI